MQTLLLVVGARPNFMKIAPVLDVLAREGSVRPVLLDVGQHRDAPMSADLLRELGMPEPDLRLLIEPGPPVARIADMMAGSSGFLDSVRPDWVVVPGDVDASLAVAIAASRARIRVAHLEAGLRCFDRSMPEEGNRVVIDHLSSLHLTPSRDADANLHREGIGPDSIRFVGNVMIDSLTRVLPAARARQPDLLRRFGLSGEFVLVTLHRPGNVDREDVLRAVLSELEEVARHIPVLFPVHPRTRARLSRAGLRTEVPSLHLTESLGYLDFLALEDAAALVITDSGGVQEETTHLGVPCLTLRPSTERPVTVSLGTNRLLPPDGAGLAAVALDRLAEPRGTPVDRPERWDGRAAERVVRALLGESR